MENPLRNLMGTMGTGPESSDPLSYDEAHEAMTALLEGDYHPVTFGGFMVAERWKSEEVEELAGFLDAIVDRDRESIGDDNPDHVDVAGKFDGKVKGINTDFPGSLLASAGGVDLFTHSGRNVPTKPEGVTFLDILAELGLDPEPDLDTSKKALEEFGFSYSNSSVYAPDLNDLKQDRQQLGVRCFLNTIESMVLPSQASVHLGAFYHLSFAKRVCDVFEASRSLDPERVIMITGMEGQTELRPGYTKIAEWNDGEFNDFDIKTGEVGIDFDRESLESVENTPKNNARLLTDWIEGNNVPKAYVKSIILNSACRLYAGRKADSIEAGIARSREIFETDALQSLWSKVTDHFS